MWILAKNEDKNVGWGRSGSSMAIKADVAWLTENHMISAGISAPNC